MGNEDKALKLQIALRRCAKAAFLLSALNSSTGLHPESSTDCRHEETWKSDIEHLKMELVKEKHEKIKLCVFVGLSVQIMLLLFLSTFFWVIVHKNP